MISQRFYFFFCYFPFPSSSLFARLRSSFFLEKSKKKKFVFGSISFTGFARVAPSCIGFYLVLPSSTGFYLVLLGFTGFGVWF